MDDFKRQHPDVPLVLPSDAAFAKAIYIRPNVANQHSIPLAVVQPRHAADVCAIVKFCSARRIPFVVRTGGNNLFGKSQVQDVLTIDMRSISYCRVDSAAGTATIGGGTLMREIYDGLEKEGCATAVGMLGSIGWAGWAMYGGYGPFMGKYGLGVQQIVGAKVVDAEGEVSKADEALLKGIRGAGGSFGVIVELTIKVYPLQAITAGFIAFNDGSISTTVREVLAGYQEVWTKGPPPQLSVAPIYFHSDHGSTTVHFLWGDDDVPAAESWVQRISSWANVVHNGSHQTSFAHATDDFADFVPPGIIGPPSTVSIRHLTPSVIEILARHAEAVPTHGSGFAIHIAPQISRQNLSDSVFAAGEPHMMIEIIECAPAESMPVAHEWAMKVLSELRATEPENVLESTYVNLTPPGGNTLDRIYGKEYSHVLALKKRMDPTGVFGLSVPFAYLQ